MPKAEIYNKLGEKVGTVELPEIAFGAKICEPVVYQYLRIYQWRKHPHLASAKTRGEVSGGGRKPWRQKGTGRARAGSIRSPLWRHGGVVFPPKPIRKVLIMPKKMRRIAFRSVLTARAEENQVKVLEDFTPENPKTSSFADLFKKIGIGEKQKTLVITDTVKKEIYLPCRNIKNITVKHTGEVNTYDLVVNDTLVIFLSALPKIEERCVI